MAKKQAKEQKTEKKQKRKGITKDMLIGEVVSNYPEAVEVLFKHGIHCIGCPMTAYESLEVGCKVHGMKDEDIDKMVKEMNEAEAKK
ncbi:hypothetical protein AYK26_06650 [Euryarchaeota archaeon SM23-78]|nr:MAG: hypothetical protein AYK26_06650 [Euryarchaeota archaeon SM23-78]MBW3000944.1 DUF1858 domain-containing protein [Candidatus Woesearchaeota archaeon]